MTPNQTYHMSPAEFRRYGQMLIDWIADYYERVESLPVLSPVEPGQIRAMLPPQPPQHGQPFEAVLQEVEQIIVPGLTHWQSPNFFAYFPANSSGPAILGDLLSTGLGVQGMLWATSPACTELETHVLDWVADMQALPLQFKSSGSGGGVILDTASTATLCAILAARERATGQVSNQQGYAHRLVVYSSTQAHSSVEKGVKISGIGRENLRLVGVDADFAMRPDLLAAQIEHDRAAGLTPALVVATIGTTSSSAIDPLPEIAQICRQHDIWLHVDAAMYGSAAICPEFRYLLNGVEGADSYLFNAHKWLLTNFDCTCFFVADRQQLVNTFSILPEYLRNQATASGQVFDYRDWGIALGRRFRALKLWFVICHYGLEGLQQHIRQHLQLAHQFAQWVEDSPNFERLAPAPLTTICFRACPPGYNPADLDRLNEALLKAVNATGHMYISHTKLNDQYTLRLAIGATLTEARHLQQAWAGLQSELAKLVALNQIETDAEQ